MRPDRRSSQVWVLLALRWRMVRSPRTRAGFALLLAGIPALLVGSVLLGASVPVPRELRNQLAGLLPTLYAGFAVLAVATPIAAGGGNELFPPVQMVAFPISVRTRFHWSLLLAPLNLGWFVQVAALLGLTAVALGDLTPRLSLGLLPIVCYLVLMSLVGQAVAWHVMGLRQSRSGRVAVWATLVAALAVAVALVSALGLTTVLDRLPTLRLLGSAYQGYRGSLERWSTLVLPLLLACLVAYVWGYRSCAWALSRVGDAGAQPEAQPLPRGSGAPTARQQLLAVDRHSAWRSVPLRRGLAVLTFLPALLVAVFRVDWSSLVLIPGIVAAGAALLFGVNVFALDGSGAVWLTSLPVDPGLVFWSKVRVLAEVCVVTVIVVVLAGAIRAQDTPSPSQLAALLGAAMATSGWVVASSLKLSVSRPHRADLRGPRDTPAPPGVMAVYSLRLALATSLIGMTYLALSLADSLLAIGVVTAGLLMLSLRSLVATSGRYSTPQTRAEVVTRVSSG